MNRFLKSACVIGVLAAVFITAVISDVQFRYADRIHGVENAPRMPVAIVLGASVKKDGTPSDALSDRVLTGVDLYRSGKVQSLLMTGDDGAFHIDEIAVMVRVAEEAGVPPEAIQTDPHGYRTYESCKRAVGEYGVENALVVTQRFHLGRALYLCRAFGMDAEGAVADRQHYVKSTLFWVRDLLASFKAFWDLRVWAPAPPA